jgi:hypothetical protein
MLPFRPAPLTPDEVLRLAALTDPLVSQEYAAQVQYAEGAWRADKLGSARDKAMAARPRGDRCVYCEDNAGSDLDHLRPKTLHPWLTFCWDNLIPACSTCGNAAHKGARDAILEATAAGHREVTRKRGEAPAPPPDGPTAWWNPRLADPMRALELDLVDQTFRFLITAPAGTADYARARWTLDTLKLNTRSNLVRQRRVAFGSYAYFLQDAVHAVASADAAKLDALRADLPDMNHPTVWAEMKRQRARLPELEARFAACPQALSW